MTKDILYIDNFNNFYLYIEVAKKSNRTWHFLIFDKKKEAICKLENIDYTLMPAFQFKTTKKFTKDIEDKFKKLIESDRILKFYPEKIALNILKFQSCVLIEIINKISPKLILGELSWANECAFYNISEIYNIKYRKILNLPFPKNKIVMFDKEHSYESLIENYLKDINASNSSISYYDLCQKLSIHNSRAKFNPIESVKNLFNVIGQIREYRSNSVYYKLYGLTLIIYRIFDKLLESSDKTQSSIENILQVANGRKIIYMPLHIQPEATPDFLTEDKINQLDIAKSILNNISSDYILAVKDHPNAFSIRNPISLFKLLLMPNFIYLSRTISSNEVIKNSHAVVTVAGTAAHEAIRLGKPAFVLSNIFYKKSKFILKVTDKTLGESLDKIFESNIYNDLDFDNIGVSGFIHDPTIFPEVLTEDNLNSINILISHHLDY